MHKKMLSILLLVGALGLAVSGVALAGASTTDFVYDVGNSSTAPGGKALHEGTSSGDAVESIGVANNAANVGVIADTATTVSIGSSTGSTAPAGDWSGAAIPSGALSLMGVTLSGSPNAWVNLNLGGVGSGLAAFNGTSENFALSIETVKSDLTGASPSNNALVVTSGGTATFDQDTGGDSPLTARVHAKQSPAGGVLCRGSSCGPGWSRRTNPR